MSLAPELLSELLGDPPLVLSRPTRAEPATPEEFAALLGSFHRLHAAAREQMIVLAQAMEVRPWCVVTACDTGVIVHARWDAALDADRAPGCRLFGNREQAPLRGGRVIVLEHEGHADCDIIVPIFEDATFSGALGLRLPTAAVTRAVGALLLQTARCIGALAQIQGMRIQHEEAVATVGHELRQPLSALVTALDLLHRLPPGANSSAFRTAQRQAVQLVRLVNTLLDASRVLGGRLRLDRHLTDLRTVLAAAADNVRADLSAKGQHLTWNLPERPVWCVIDTERLQEVVLNLLTNAHRYTPEGGTIEVSAEQQGEAAVMFTVRDTGVGLAPETRDRVFRPFERHSHSPQGLGLGLTISLGIVRAHGGNISVDSNEPDPGSTFRVELPGVLGRTREICAAVQRTRSQTRVLVERSRALRAGLEPATGTSRRGRE